MATAAKYELTWELDSLLPHPGTDSFQQIMKQYRADLERIADSSDRLPAISDDPECVRTWSTFLRDYADISGRAQDLDAFIGCQCAAEAENKEFQKLEAMLASLEPYREQMATNLELALQVASEEQLASLVEADKYLGEIEFFLRDRRANALLRLPREQELLAADLAVDGIHAWGRLYDRVSGELKISVMERGQIVKKSPGQVQFDSPQRTVRENNFFAADTAWQSIADTCADALNHMSGWRLTRYRRLNLQDHLEAPLRLNRMSRATLDAMWSTIAARKGPVVNYLNKKAELLGLEKLAWYDLQAPLPQSAKSAAE